MKDRRLRHSGVAHFSSTSQLLNHRLVNDADCLMYGTQRAELDIWI